MIYRFGNKKPSISKNAFIAETASIIGDISIGERSSVWFNSVIILHGAQIGEYAIVGAGALVPPEEYLK